MDSMRINARKSFSGFRQTLCNNKMAFTLAEMMVVMLIMSIVLAAMAPVMTTKMKADKKVNSSPWAWADNGSDAYFKGLNETNKVFIGQKDADADTAKLVINSANANYDHILFKKGSNILGKLNLTDNTLLLGSLAEGTTQNANTIAIGKNVSLSSANSTATYATVIGNSALADGILNTSLGYNAQSLYNGATPTYATAIGAYTKAKGVGAIALGAYSEVYGNKSIGIGSDIGTDTNAVKNSIAIGNSITNAVSNSIAIGNNIKTNHAYDIFVGNAHDSSTDYTSQNIKIGNISSNSTGTNNIIIGEMALEKATTTSDNIAIGKNALYYTQTGGGNVAIGHDACSGVTGSNKICIGNNSGPTSAHSTEAADDIERIYIGSKAKGTNNPTFIDNELGSAVLEVHNDPSYQAKVIINGNLIVRGSIAVKPNNRNNFTQMDVGGDSGGATDQFQEAGNNNIKINDYDSLLKLNFSDRRLKNVGKESTDGLDKIKQLKVFNYTFKKDETKTPRVGVMAQDLQKIFPDAVKKAADGFLTIRMEDMFYAMVNAIKELDAKVTAMTEILKQVQNDVKGLHEENKQIKNEMKLLREQNKNLEKRIKELK